MSYDLLLRFTVEEAYEMECDRAVAQPQPDVAIWFGNDDVGRADGDLVGPQRGSFRRAIDRLRT